MTNDECGMTNVIPRNAQELLTQAVAGLQHLSFTQAQRETHTLHIEPPHANLLRRHAQSNSNQEAA